ncbi:MAG: InlB B-repeat-containing protein, partial [Bacteroidales bacterium]|nr:InlB B-repeat-containing protein [Bacteroidales bacterium]
MKRLTFLFLMLVAYVTTSMAQVDTNKQYRLKDNATGQYLTAFNHDEHASGPVGGIGTSAYADSDEQIFVFEQSGSNYKMKTKSGYYLYAYEWNVDALSSKSTEVKFIANGTSGYYMQVNNSVKGGWYYVKNENVPSQGGYFIFGDAVVGEAATWTFEEVVVAVPSRTITVSANNDAWGTVSGGGTAEGAITITATPADGCKFVEWQLNGIQISTQQNYIDETEGDKEYVAIFAELEPYELICKPTFNKAGNTTFVSAATILADGETSTIDVAELAVLGQQGFVNVGETYAGATFDLNLTYTLNWGDLSLFQIAGDEATSIYGPFEGSWVSGGSTTTVLTNIVNAGLTVEGTTVTYPITISSESQIGDLVVIRAITGATSACETGISEGGYIDFVFTVATPPCTVTATSSNVVMGTVTPEESKINSGNNVTLTATPNEGYEFVNWTVAGEEVSTDATYTFTVTQDIEVVANFQIIPGTQTFNITVSSANETMGSVVASTLEVVDGNTVTLTATPNDGYRFVNWTVAGEEVSTDNPYTATITAETAFVANFEALPVYVVSVSSSDETMGTAEISAAEAMEGKTVTLTATPKTGFLFVNWTVAGEEVSTDNPYTATITAETAFVANFVEKQYCVVDGAMANTGNGAGRMLNSFTLSDGISQLEVASIQTSATDAVYKDKTDLVLTTNPGATMNFSAMSWTGSWMHAYVFVDYNKDKEFNQELNNGGTTTGEVVSYNAYNVSTTETEDWRDAKGQSVSAGCGVTNGNIPSWTLPANMAAGDYRLRFKIDWNSINACGDTDIKNNNGCIVDITLRIELPLVPTYNVTAVANDAAMGSVTSAMTEQDVYTMEATANEGYEFVNWTVAGAEVSTNATFTYTATADAEVVANFQIIAEWPATVEALATAEALIAQTGVGFPATTSAAYTALQSAIEAATAAPTIAQKAALDAAIPAYYAETEVTMPEAGKAYAMVAAVTPSQQFYVYNNSDVLGLADYTGAEFAEEAKFLCSIVDGKYVFQNVTNNKYFAYPTKTSVDWMTGVSNSGLEAELQDISKFEIFKLAVGANANVTATAEQLLGMVYMFGLRGYKSGVEEKGAIVVKNDKTFDGAGTPFCNGTFTSAIRLVEVEYTAPTPVYAVSAEAAPADGGQVTISATEVEENGTVELTATANTGYNFVNWTVEGVEVSTSESFTSEAITEATTFVANFVKQTFNVTVTAGKGGSVEPIASPVEYGTQITLTATPDAGYEFVVWMVDGGEGSTQNPWTTVVTEDLDFEAIFGLTKQGDLYVTTDSKEETADASYTNVNVANGNVWDVQANTITADKVAVKVEADGTTPEIKIEDGGQITAVLEVSRVVEKEKWALMSLPFAVDLANVTVDGAPAVKDSNIKVLVYDASYRATN